MIRITHIRYTLEYPRFDTHLDKGSEDGSHHLDDKGGSRGYFDIMTELEILDERGGFCQGLDGIGFKDHVGERITGKEGAGDDLGQNVEGDALTGHGVDEARGEDVDDGEDDGEDESPYGDLGVPDLDGDDRQAEKDTKGTEIPPIGDLWIVPHELGMDVIGLDTDFFEAVEKGAAVVEEGVNDDTGAEGKSEEVGHGVGSGEVEGGIGVVGVEIKGIVGAEDAGDVVDLAEFVVGFVGGDGKVGELPSVGVVECGGEDPVKEDKTEKDVDLGPPGDHEGAADPADLGPIQGEKAHAHAGVDAKKLIEGDVLGSGPADKGKDGEGFEEVAGEEEEEKGGGHDDDEEAVAGDAFGRGDVGDGKGHGEGVVFVFCMEGVEEGAGDEVLGPDHASGPNEEAPAETSEAKAGELGGKDEDGGEPEAEMDVVKDL